MTAGAEWAVQALKFTTQSATRSSNFLRYEIYGEPDGELQCDFSMWVVRGPHGLLLVDTGFAQEAASARGQFIEADVETALREAGHEPVDVEAIVYSHLHYDHCGNLELFPNAMVYVQREEYDFWHSPLAQRAQFAGLWEQGYGDNLEVARLEGRLVLLDGDTEIVPGITALKLGGHTVGTQAVQVDAPHRRVLLAADAVHYGEELERDWPFAVVADLPAMYRAFDRLNELRRAGVHVIPGHDVSTRENYPSRSLPCNAVLVDLLG